MLKNLDKLCSSVLRNTEILNYKLGCLAKDISKQSVKGMAQCFLDTYDKIRKEKERYIEKAIVKQKGMGTSRSRKCSTYPCCKIMR